MLITNTEINNISGPKSPIIYPIGMVIAASPKDAAIIKWAVLFCVILILNCVGRVKNRPNIADKKIPKRNAPPNPAKN